MKHTEINESELKSKSEEFDIPFPNLLAGYILEELMYLITDSSFDASLLLKNTEIFGVEQYRSRNSFHLDFAYLLDEKIIGSGKFAAGQEISLKLGYIMLASVLKEEKTPGITWRGRVLRVGEQMEIEITGELYEMTVPFGMTICPILAENLLPEKNTLVPFMRQQEAIQYQQYPWEMLLSESLYDIIKDMEQISQMRAYDTVYRILSREFVNGRHILEYLYFYCKRDGLEADEERLEVLLSYEDYIYMKKKWEKYAGQQNREMPSWEDIFVKMKKFLPPIWEAICRDEIYCGDWMPELGRFFT